MIKRKTMKTQVFLSLYLFLYCCVACFAAPVIRNVECWTDAEGVVNVRWRTTEAAKCVVKYGVSRDVLKGQVEEDPSSLRGSTNSRNPGIGFACNHRVNIKSEQCIYLRIDCTDASGSTSVSEIFQPAAPLPVNEVKLSRVRVSLDGGDWPLDNVPYCFGLPLKQGELADQHRVRIVDAVGNKLPIQVQAKRWRRDRSVKWLRIDTIAPAALKEAFVEFGREVEPEIAVDMKPPQFDTDFSLELTDPQGVRYAADMEAHGYMEEFGRVKCVLRRDVPFVNGDKKLCKAQVRVHIWHALGSVSRVDVTFENDRTDQEMTSFTSLEFLSGKGKGNVVVGVPGRETVELSHGQRVLQQEDFQWMQDGGNKKGKRIEGVAAITPQKHMVLRDFWQQWPVSVESRGDRVVFGLLPGLPEKFYANRKDEDKYYCSIRDGLHTFREGWSKTWELWRCYGLNSEMAGKLAQKRPVAAVDPLWIENSGAYGKMAIAANNQFPGYNERMAQMVSKMPVERDARREYGMMNYGDWYGERVWNWGNLEYDLGHALLMQFFRTGTGDFMREAELAIRHERDVDTRHYAKDPRRVGQQWIHSIGHTAGYYDNKYKDMKIYAGTGWSDNRGHVWNQGMLEHALSGGDLRSWDTGLLIADWVAGPQSTNWQYGLAREPGWMLKIVMATYRATDDPYYLNSARIMLEECQRKTRESAGPGFFVHKLYSGHCNCPPDKTHYGEAGFMLATQMTGMVMFHEETGDNAVAEDIAKISRYIVDVMWQPELYSFRYTSCPKTRGTISSSWILMQGLAFGARYAKDKELAMVCREALATAWNALPSSGKTSGYILCCAPQALQQMSELSSVINDGVDFSAYMEHMRRKLRSQVRRNQPGIVPNPGFENDIKGWLSRGWRISRSTDVKHSGTGSLKIYGAFKHTGEFVNTSYDTGGNPLEIFGVLIPGREYRISAWLRVDKYEAGAPAPSLRVQFRDDSRSRESAQTTSYDMNRIGTWQRLDGSFKVPEYNTRNYIALNTNGYAGVINCEMYLDDVFVVPASATVPELPGIVSAEPKAAVLSTGLVVNEQRDFGTQHGITGSGIVKWKVSLPAGEFDVWVQAQEGCHLGMVSVGGQVVNALKAEENDWYNLGKVKFTNGGNREIIVDKQSGKAALGKVVLANMDLSTK